MDILDQIKARQIFKKELEDLAMPNHPQLKQIQAALSLFLQWERSPSQLARKKLWIKFCKVQVLIDS